MKTLLFALTGIMTFVLVTQLLYAKNYGDRSIQHDLDGTRGEVRYAPPYRGIPTITLPSGTR
ncbi:MAG: hypothetical protein J7647_05855 [Cyanobacteria bacterium SBLK]|nr:hypothetical protein [Cyanobacteria bacterium SBLK]